MHGLPHAVDCAGFHHAPYPTHAMNTAPTDPLRFAVVGCGMLAQQQHLPNLVASPFTELTVCCDLSDANLAACSERFKPRHLLTDFHEAVAHDEVDAVCLATTEKLRLPVIRAAAEAGKPVYVEKPLARSLDEMRQIRDVVKQAGIPLCVGHNRRSAPAMLEAQRIFSQHMSSDTPCPWRFDREGDNRPAHLRDDVPGMSVRVNDDWWSWKAWVFDPEQAPHGSMLFEMTHFTDLCNWFMDDQPEVVTALATEPFHHGVTIKYRGGAIATIAMCATGTFGYPKELLEVMGRGGMVVVDHLVEVRTAGIDGVDDRILFERTAPRGTDMDTTGGIDRWLADRRAACQRAAEAGDPSLQFQMADADKGHAHHLARFVEEVRSGGPEVAGVDAALSASEIAFAAIESAKSGRAVRIDEL